MLNYVVLRKKIILLRYCEHVPLLYLAISIKCKVYDYYKTAEFSVMGVSSG